MKSQNQKVLEHLKKYRTITTWTAITRYHITRLSGRIYDLIKSGHNITAKIVYEKNKHWAEYRLER